MNGPAPTQSDLVVVWRDEAERFVLDRESIQTQELTAQELGILIYAISVFTDTSLPPEKRTVEIEDLIRRFPEDEPISLAMSVKRLTEKEYLEDDPRLDVDMLDLLQEAYGVNMQ